MERNGNPERSCPFCAGRNLRLRYAAAYHPFVKDHGPWDLHQCVDCGSLVTDPLPSSEQLARLYASFDGGMIPSVRRIRDKYPLHAWFEQCLRHAIRDTGRGIGARDMFQWMDIGAGGGEMSLLISGEYPASKGIALDISSRPSSLDGSGNVTWVQDDLLEPADIEAIPRPDLAVSITVTEHLAHPDVFLKKWAGHLAEQGCLYITTPRADCAAFRMMGRKWPYIIPGEHLHIPTRKGMDIMLHRIGRELYGEGAYEVRVGSVVLPYPLGYFMEYLGLSGSWLGKVSGWPMRLPTGLLEASLRRK